MRYDFNHLFSVACFKAMTGGNITARFQVAGICPYNTEINVLGITKKEFTPFDS